MKIKKKIRQHGRGFTAIYACEYCGHEKEGEGYDDTNFHANVIPNMKCDQCGETSPDNYTQTINRIVDEIKNVKSESKNTES